MKIFMLIFLGILAFNALVILAVACILLIDHMKARRRETESDVEPETS